MNIIGGDSVKSFEDINGVDSRLLRNEETAFSESEESVTDEDDELKEDLNYSVSNIYNYENDDDDAHYDIYELDKDSNCFHSNEQHFGRNTKIYVNVPSSMKVNVTSLQIFSNIILRQF